MLLVLVLMSGLVFGVAPFLGSGWQSAPESDMVPSVAPSPPMEPTISPPEGAGPFRPKTYREGGFLVMPVTFPDGTTAEVLYPKKLGTGGIGQFAYLEGVPDKCSPNVKLTPFEIVDIWTRPGPPLAVFEGADGDPVGFWDGLKWAEPWDVLAFDFGPWVGVILCEAHPVEDADALALVARSVDAHESKDGFLVVTPRSPIRFARGGEQVGPRIGFEQDVGPERDQPLVELTLSGCSPSAIELTEATAQGCLEGGISLYALGDRGFLEDVAASLRVRNVRRP